MIRYIIILIIGILLLNSCREDLEPKPYTYSRLLTGENAKHWRMTGLQFREEGKVPQTFQLPNDCVFDDDYVFYNSPDKKFEVQEGLSKCNENDPDVFVTDNWALVSARATLEMVVPILAPFKLPFILKELTEDRLVIEIYFNENKQSYRMVFKRVKTE